MWAALHARWSSVRAAWGLLLGTCLACGGGIPLESVPDDPIAFVRQEAAKGQLGLDVFREGMQLKAFEEAGREHRVKLRTSLSLLEVPSGEIRSVPDATEGSLPLDWSADGYRLLIGRMTYAGGPIELYTWNRLTGVYIRLNGAPVGGSAALGVGPIRLAGVGRVPLEDGSTRWGVVLQTDGERNLPLAGGAGGIDPDVAPDGRTVVCARPYDALSLREPVLWISSLGDGEPRSIGRGSHPRFSRDGHWIVFTRTRAGNADVWRMRADGTRKRAIATSSYDEEFPSASRDGRYVVYASARGLQEEVQLFMTRVADGEEIQLTQNGQNGRPIW